MGDVFERLPTELVRSVLAFVVGRDDNVDDDADHVSVVRLAGSSPAVRRVCASRFDNEWLALCPRVAHLFESTLEDGSDAPNVIQLLIEAARDLWRKKRALCALFALATGRTKPETRDALAHMATHGLARLEAQIADLLKTPTKRADAPSHDARDAVERPPCESDNVCGGEDRENVVPVYDMTRGLDGSRDHFESDSCDDDDVGMVECGAQEAKTAGTKTGGEIHDDDGDDDNGGGGDDDENGSYGQDDDAYHVLISDTENAYDTCGLYPIDMGFDVRILSDAFYAWMEPSDPSIRNPIDAYNDAAARGRYKVIPPALVRLDDVREQDPLGAEALRHCVNLHLTVALMWAIPEKRESWLRHKPVDVFAAYPHTQTLFRVDDGDFGAYVIHARPGEVGLVPGVPAVDAKRRLAAEPEPFFWMSSTVPFEMPDDLQQLLASLGISETPLPW